ncbi:hypothetical protein MSPP1_001548 [Malassezia sp. CBS 17886]|nr:hypothetical protein MSPP1_001548 [Malassezia sp. CBS 17886]
MSGAAGDVCDTVSRADDGGGAAVGGTSVDTAADAAGSAAAAPPASVPASGGVPDPHTHAPPRATEPPVAGARGTPSHLRAPPPAPTEKPFDFNRFLEQMKHRSAVPVNEYVRRQVAHMAAHSPRSFFRGFSKRPYKPADQVKLIFDFLDFITARMTEATVWAELPAPEFDQAAEAMEKLIMNRLYTYTYAPAIAQEGRWPVQTDDLVRDAALTERIRTLAWVREEHLDVQCGSHSDRFYAFAVQELNKIGHYKAPRDKIICILNCCKVIFGLIRHLDTDEGADAFVPLLILVLLRANPPHLMSNMEYILRFKNPERRTSEADYYLSSLMGAIAFIEGIGPTTLNISEAEFHAHMAAPASGREAGTAADSAAAFDAGGTRPPSQDVPLQASVAALSLADDTRAFLHRTGEAARVGFASGLGRPMDALGKLFAERLEGGQEMHAVAGEGGEEGLGAIQGGAPGGAIQGGAPGGAAQGGAPEPLGEPETSGAPSAAPGRDAPRGNSATAPNALKPIPLHTRNLKTPAPRAPEPPARGVAPHAPLRARQMSPTSPADASVEAGSEEPPSLVHTPGRTGAQRAPQWRGGVQSRFLEQDSSDVSPRESPTHHVAAAHFPGDDSLGEDADESVDVGAAVQTLQSIFPQADESVLQLVLQESRGNVEMAIDRLLEMT